MKHLLTIKFLFLLCIFILASCSERSNNFYNAIDIQAVYEDVTILDSVQIDEGHITFFERNKSKDIGVAFIDKNKNKSKTAYGGYLSQNPEHAPWHYTSKELSKNVYSIYYGRLDEKKEGKVYIEISDHQLKKEAQLMEGSSSLIWYVIFDERVETFDLNIYLDDEKLPK